MAIGFKKKSLFGKRPAWTIPGIGDQHNKYNLAQPMPQAAPEKKGGFFGKGGTGRAIAGIAGDVLLQNSGYAPIYAPAMAQQRDFQAQQLEAAQKRADDLRERSLDRQDKLWEHQNIPSNNDTQNDYDFILKTIGPEAAEEFLRNKANPPVWRQGPDGQFYRVDTPQGGMGYAPDTLPSDFDFGAP